MGQLGIIVVYVVALGALMYFFAIKPQKKQQKEQQQLMDSMEIGDYVLTTSGFYGVILDITEDDVIVEFGNNKNCRITMQKKAIADKRYMDKAYNRIVFQIPYDSVFEKNFEDAVAISGETKATYVRNALTRKLTKDGFLPPKAE